MSRCVGSPRSVVAMILLLINFLYLALSLLVWAFFLSASGAFQSRAIMVCLVIGASCSAVVIGLRWSCAMCVCAASFGSVFVCARTGMWVLSLECAWFVLVLRTVYSWVFIFAFGFFLCLCLFLGFVGPCVGWFLMVLRSSDVCSPLVYLVWHI